MSASAQSVVAEPVLKAVGLDKGLGTGNGDEAPVKLTKVFTMGEPDKNKMALMAKIVVAEVFVVLFAFAIVFGVGLYRLILN